MKEQKNVSALLFDAFSRRKEFSVQFGVELKEVNSDFLTFELDELDKNIFLNYYNKLPTDRNKRFKVKLDFEE